MNDWLRLEPDAYLRRRQRERRIKLAAAVIGTLTLVALFAWALPG